MAESSSTAAEYYDAASNGYGYVPNGYIPMHDLEACNGYGYVPNGYGYELEACNGYGYVPNGYIPMHDHIRDLERDLHPRKIIDRQWTENVTESLLEQSLNGQVIIPVRGNDIDDDDSGIVATPDSNPVQGNDRGDVQNISSLFATCHGAILAVVALIMSAPVPSAVRIFILFISALVSVAIIRDLVVKSYKEFSAKRGQQSLRNSLVANQWWVTQRIVLFLIFIMLSLYLLLASNRMLRLHHH